MSFDGLDVTVSSYDGVWTSRDGGISFTQRLAGRRFTSVTCSADGAIQTAMQEPDGILYAPMWVSSDEGSSWVPGVGWGSAIPWANFPAMSADGSVVLGILQSTPTSAAHVVYWPSRWPGVPVTISGTAGASIRFVHLGDGTWAVVDATGTLEAMLLGEG
jgi:hypothetical protein